MKVLQINSCFGCLSTGRIVSDIATELIASGHECLAAYGLEFVDRCVPAVKIGTRLGIKFNTLYARLFDREGFGAYFATKRFLKKVDAYKPDVVHLHNLHGNYINIRLLFQYLAKHDIPTVLTLHDCWLLTGHCASFSGEQCDKWKSECMQCERKNCYPKSYFFDQSRKNYREKKTLLADIKNLSVICVSQWLADIVAESHVRERGISVIHNGIDTDVFRPCESDFRERYDLKDKKILLGVASSWGKQKGLEDFVRLAQMLDPSFQIVLVGLTQEQIQMLPSNILGLGRTKNAQELAEIYSAADVFVCLSYAETFGLVNAEAMACGTPVIAYRTGAVPEIVQETVGVCVEVGDLDAVIRAVQDLEPKLTCTELSEYVRACFDIKVQNSKYVAYYQQM